MRTVLALLAGLLLVGRAHAQQEVLQIGGQAYTYCGYVLLAGIAPLAESDLTLISYLTPPETDTINPYQMFQTRWNLAGNAVIVEGCFVEVPTRELIVQLLDAAMPGLSDAQINAELEYTSFADVESTRAYLSANRAQWESE